MKPVLIKGGIQDQPAVMRTNTYGAIELRLLDRVTARNTAKLSNLSDDDYVTGWVNMETLGIKPRDIKNSQGLPKVTN